MVLYVQPGMSRYTGRVIYKFICPEGRVYVGLASTSYKRIAKHNNEADAKKDGQWKDNSRWKKAIRKFGWDKLVVEILERVPDDVSLKERERYWIAHYNANDPEYGYNSNKGGGGVIKHTEKTKAKISANRRNIGTKPVTSCKIKQEYADGTQLVEYVSYLGGRDAARKTGILSHSISTCCVQGKGSAGERFWHFTTEDSLVGEHRIPSIGQMPRASSKKRTVISVSPDGAERQVHKSISAAARTLTELTGKKFNDSAIGKCCSEKYNNKQHHGYKFYFGNGVPALY